MSAQKSSRSRGRKISVARQVLTHRARDRGLGGASTAGAEIAAASQEAETVHQPLMLRMGYLVILAMGIGAVWFCLSRSNSEYHLAKINYKIETGYESHDVANAASLAFTQIYQNIRTISFLPSVRDIDRHGANLDANARTSIQQIYNNLASNVAISEVYVVPADFDPERIDPVTGKPEEPILMFDELISANPKNAVDPNRVVEANPEGSEEVEIEEYRLLRQQMAWFREHYPEIGRIDGMQVPFANTGPVITCDNSIFNKTRNDADRTGVIFSVPFYGHDGRFKGTISAIMLSKAIGNILPEHAFALVDKRHGHIVAREGDAQVAASREWVEKGLADPSLIMSSAANLALPAAGTDWHLWVGYPNEAFYKRPEIKALFAQRNISIAACLVLTVLAVAFWRQILKSRAAEVAHWRDLSEATLEGLVICHEGRIATSNRRFQTMVGRSARELRGMRLEDIIAEPGVAAALESAANHYAETNLIGRDGQTFPVEILAHSMGYGGRRNRVLAIRDQSNLHEAEKKIRFLALRDPLTELANRNRFMDALQNEIKHRDPERRFAVICLDLDSFKHVNDTLGHGVGDKLLRIVAGRLETSVRESDLVARMGGDEFAILQAEGSQPEGATALASRIIEVIEAPFQIDGHRIAIGTSIGIAVAPDDGEDAETLLKNADLALYRAKSDGKHTFRLFEAEMDAKMQARRMLELELQQAMGLNQFEVFYQPIMQAGSNTICSFEALLRWRHPTRGLVPPLDFIPLAEETGLMGKLGAWVLKQACGDAKSWPDHIRVAVNVSPAQFRRRALELDVITALESSGLPAHRLEVEITESVLLEDSTASLATLERIHALGVKIAMDDFGTGYSSLSYLQKFPFDKIKIDKSFVNGACQDSPGEPIIQAILSLANSFGMRTTAEGVETACQFDYLASAGCSEIQGYFCGKPMPLKDSIDFATRLETKAAS